MVCRDALEKAGLKAKDIAAIGITKPARDHRGVGPRHRPGDPIAPSSGRTAAPPTFVPKLKNEGHEPMIWQKPA